MKPLYTSEIESFLSRFQSFTESEIKSITVKSPTVIEIRFSVQDSGRSFDWIDIVLELSNVSDAKLIDNSKLAYLDMSEGISILSESHRFIICHGEYNSFDFALDSALYIICESVKFEEQPFSG